MNVLFSGFAPTVNPAQNTFLLAASSSASRSSEGRHAHQLSKAASFLFVMENSIVRFRSHYVLVGLGVNHSRRWYVLRLDIQPSADIFHDNATPIFGAKHRHCAALDESLAGI